MADADRNIIEIIVQGAEQAVRRVETVVQAQSQLATVIESTGVRQRVVYDSVAQAAERSALAEEKAAKRAETAARVSAEARIAALQRVRDEMGRFLSEQQVFERQLARATQVAGTNLQDPRRLQAAVGASQFTARREEILAEQRRIAEGIAQQGGLQARTLAPEQLDVARQAAAFTAARNAALAQAAAAQTLQGRLQALGQTISTVVRANFLFADITRNSARALDEQGNAADRTTRRSITYLSVLSAIHAASFLATSQTFSMLGSFITLGAAFGKVSVAAAGVGLVLGGALAIFGQIDQAMQRIQQIAITAAVGLATFAVAASAAAVAGGAAGVQLAAGVETQLASVRAFGLATSTQLEQVQQQAIQFSEQFGVSAASVVEATSLFARAGGSVQEAIDGATEAIVKLTVASQGELQAAQAAIALSAALKQFNIDASDSIRVADALTAAAQASALSFIGVQQALIQAAPGAKTLGISLEDTTATIALLGDQLIKGTISGTAFKQFLLDVINPSARAKEEFAKYGIAVEEAGTGKIRPFIDILADLNKALGDEAVEQGKVTEGARALALARIFESRAGLAANILTREGAEGLQKYREELAKTSTSNIVDVLLLPLNKQLERLQIVVQNTGKAFGGPLLEPIRTAVVTAINLFQQLRPIIEAAGQTVAVLATGQGFGQLQNIFEQLASNTRLAHFLNELVNSFRNVRDVVTSQIVPAIQDFLSSIGRATGIVAGFGSTTNVFDRINNAIQLVGAALAIGIRRLGEFAGEIITNTGEGARFRQTIAAIATVIITNLVTGLATSVAFMTIAFKVMEGLGNIIQNHVLPNVDRLGQALILLGRIGQGAVAAITAPFTAVAGAAAAANAILEGKGPEEAINKAREAASAARGPMGGIADSYVALGEALRGVASEGRTSGATIDAILSEARANANETIKSFQDLSGEIPDALSNLRAQLDQEQREAAARSTATTGAAPEVDTTGIDRARARVEEAARDVQRRLDNLSEDAAQKLTNNAARALERLDDIFTNARDRIADLQQQTDDRIADLFRGIDERREDRGQLEAVRESQEKQIRILQERHDTQERLEQRALDRIRARNQQATEDYERSVEQQFDDTETLRQRQIEVAQRAFDQIQQIQETAFDRALDAEATAFQRQQQAAAEARSFSLSLIEAKTPEDRTNLLKQRQRTLADTKFQQGQEDALTKFRQTQEEKKRKFQQSQEAAAIIFRQTQEDSFTQFRRRQEVNLLTFRRDQERIARDVREAEEDTITIPNRQRREREMLEFRKQLEKEFQAEQDKIEDKRAGEQRARIIAEATKEANKILANAEKQAGEVIDQLILQNEEQAADLDKQLRNIQDTLRDLGDSVPPEVLSNLLTAQAEAMTRAQAIRGELERLRGENLLKVQQAAAVGVADLITRVRPGETPTDLAIPAQVLAVQTLQVASMVIPPELLRGVGLEFLGALRAASQEGLFPEPTTDLTTLEEGIQSMRRFFRT